MGRKLSGLQILNYRFEIQGRYFLVAILAANILAEPFLIVDMRFLVGLLLFNLAGITWCMWTLKPKQLAGYGRFHNFLYVRRASAPSWVRYATVASCVAFVFLSVLRWIRHGRIEWIGWIAVASSVSVIVLYMWPLPAPHKS